MIYSNYLNKILNLSNKNVKQIFILINMFYKKFKKFIFSEEKKLWMCITAYTNIIVHIVQRTSRW